MSKTWIENDFEDTCILGLDEAGRGPMAGPCVVAGVVLPKGYTHPLINDSKQLSAKQSISAIRHFSNQVRSFLLQRLARIQTPRNSFLFS